MSSSTSRTAFRLLILFIAQISLTTAATLSFDWNVTWVTANPTGNFSRPVVGINGQWPTPVINATKGDRIIVNLYNGLGNESTSLHFHGLFQNGSNTMDGPGMVTQCNMLPGHSMTYNFTLDQTGLYWYHSHTNGQYSDGFRQAIAIQDPVSPYAGKYDGERIITVSDWYYQQVPILLKQFISVSNPTGAEPIPNAALINDTSNFQMDVEPGKTYLLRFANVGGFASQYVWIEGHTMRIVEVDGVWVDEAETDMFYIAVAQRYSVLVTMKNETNTNFPIVASMDTTLFDKIPKGLNWNVTGHIVYDTSAEMPAATLIDEYDAYDDVSLVPVDGEKALKEADHIITLDMKMNDLGNGANYAMFNNKSYVYPKVPALYTALSAGQLATNPAVYGADSQSFVLNRGDVVDIVLNNFDTGKHPFHLHGHQFQVLQRSAENAGTWNASTAGQGPAVPMRRDTLVVRPLGNFQIRYVADNPGVWFFHCHITWHLATGLAITLIEAPLDLQKNLTIPQSHKDVCAAAGVPITGNAAGNTENYLDLAGQNMEVHPLPGGFTTKGYVAMAFSCLSGGLGLVAIAWYGMAPIQTSGQS